MSPRRIGYENCLSNMDTASTPETTNLFEKMTSSGIPMKFKRDGSPSHCLRSKKPPLTLKPAALPPKFKFFLARNPTSAGILNEITTRYPLIAF